MKTMADRHPSQKVQQSEIKLHLKREWATFAENFQPYQTFKDVKAKCVQKFAIEDGTFNMWFLGKLVCESEDQIQLQKQQQLPFYKITDKLSQIMPEMNSLKGAHFLILKESAQHQSIRAQQQNEEACNKKKEVDEMMKLAQPSEELCMVDSLMDIILRDPKNGMGPGGNSDKLNAEQRLSDRGKDYLQALRNRKDDNAKAVLLMQIIEELQVQMDSTYLKGPAKVAKKLSYDMIDVFYTELQKYTTA